MNPICAEEFALTFETAVIFVFFVSSRIVLCMNLILLLSYLWCEELMAEGKLHKLVK